MDNTDALYAKARLVVALASTLGSGERTAAKTEALVRKRLPALNQAGVLRVGSLAQCTIRTWEFSLGILEYRVGSGRPNCEWANAKTRKIYIVPLVRGGIPTLLPSYAAARGTPIR